jgi:hypothetical protein
MLRTSGLAIALFVLALVSPARIAAQRGPGRGTAGANPFVGAWKLVSIERRNPDGSLIPGVNPVGGVNPTGMVMYDAGGHMSLQIMPGGRAKTLNTLQPLTPEQSQSALFGFVSYYGTYTIEEAKKTLHLHFDGAINPSMVGTDGTRLYEFNGNRMIFHAGNNVLSWEKM